jgi:MFS family permease
VAGALTSGTSGGPVVRVGAGAVVIAVVTVLPMFLTAGLAVQIGTDLGFAPSALGIAPGAFFGAMVLTSPFAGRLVNRLGAVRAIRWAVVVISAVLVLTAATTQSLPVLAGYLALAGVANAMAQPATNLLLAQHIPRNRQGTAYGAKQSAIPIASMLAGLAVPALALTVGWRWAFAAFAVIAALAACWPFQTARGLVRTSAADIFDIRLPRRTLVLLAVGVSFAAAGGSTLAIFMVASAVDTGLAEASAGLLFALASGVGIAARLLSGLRADQRGRNHLWFVSLMLVVGAVGVGFLATDHLTLFVVGAPIAFGAGWGWPGVFILSIVNLHPTNPAAATALTQIGTSAGCVVGPLTFGALAGTWSYQAAWGATAAALLLAAAVLLVGRRQVLAHLSTIPSDSLPWRSQTRSTTERRAAK